MHDFVEIAGGFRSRVEEALKKLFTPAGILTDADIPAPLVEPLRYALLGGGKRLRPVCCLAACATVSGRSDMALPAALAIEMLHNYTLVHDDLPCMDNDLLRRGQPTVHAKYGYGEAVLVGDALQAAAFEMLFRSPVSPERICRLANVFARAAGPAGVVGGQWEDCCVTASLSKERLDYIYAHKTGDLICAALDMGVLAGGGSDAEADAFHRYGLALGTAFQIIDDLLDADDPAKAEEISILRLMGKDEALALAKQTTDDGLRALDEVRPAGSEQEAAHALLRHLAISQISRTL